MKSSTVNIALHVLQELSKVGVQEFCVCPSSRNSAFVSILDNQDLTNPYYFFEERSAAFFALGRARQTKKGVAIITTSGTAAGELLPAVMEAYYSGVPLVLVTADRPRRYRGTGAPQAAEQVGLFGIYASHAEDLEGFELCDLSKWDRQSPLHLNVCLEDPNREIQESVSLKTLAWDPKPLDTFLSSVINPFVIVSQLDVDSQESVVDFLVKLNCPVFLEGTSGLREHAKLQLLQVRQIDNLMQTSERCGYKIDGVLRIGGVPTFNFWRDLEGMQPQMKVCSISRVPFKGLTYGSLIETNIKTFLEGYELHNLFQSEKYEDWLTVDVKFSNKLEQLFVQEPKASQSLIHALSKLVPKKSHVYLGNSLPIREWDLAATFADKQLHITASRGLNGIDGQISTFLGLCTKDRDNFAILGDLTTLYDMAAPWILPQIPDISATIFVINNGGGKIFSRMFASDVFQNNHELSFRPLAEMWDMEYERWEFSAGSLGVHDAEGEKQNEDEVKDKKIRKFKLIEVVPDNEASLRFSDELAQF